jgi:hypothetical protein
MFGRPSRLRLALWIQRHAGDRFYQSEPPKSVIAQSAAGGEFSRLVALGMLTEHREAANRRVYYERTRSPLWSIVSAADTVSDDLILRS